MSAEPITDQNRHLLECDEYGFPKDGQERTTPKSYENQLRRVLQGPSNHNCAPAAIYVDEFHETKSNDAPTPKHVLALKQELASGIYDGSPQKESQTPSTWLAALKSEFLQSTPFVCGFSGHHG